MPFFRHITGKEIGALPVVLVAILKDGKICFLKRKKRPYKGYWGMIGGKVQMHESIEETALREAKEETGLDCEFVKINKVVYERVNEGGKFKHAFVLFFVSVNADKDDVIECDEGEVKGWKLARILISKVANKITGRIINLQLNDFTSGFRCYSKGYLTKALPQLHSETYEIQIETLRQAKLQNSKIGEIPIIFENRKKGKSKLTLTEIAAFSKYILKVSWEQLRTREN